MSVKNRGFASMSLEKRRQVSSEGGKAAHTIGTAHEWTREESIAAAKKGHESRRRKRQQNHVRDHSP